MVKQNEILTDDLAWTVDFFALDKVDPGCPTDPDAGIQVGSRVSLPSEMGTP